MRDKLDKITYIIILLSTLLTAPSAPHTLNDLFVAALLGTGGVPGVRIMLNIHYSHLHSDVVGLFIDTKVFILDGREPLPLGNAVGTASNT